MCFTKTKTNDPNIHTGRNHHICQFVYKLQNFIEFATQFRCLVHTWTQTLLLSVKRISTGPLEAFFLDYSNKSKHLSML